MAAEILEYGSQSIGESVPISLLWERLHPLGVREGLFMLMLWGHIDESGDGKGDLFSLSVVVAVGFVWLWIEERWKAVIEEKNRELVAQGRKPISRFHAAACNSRVGEFEGWSVDEQIEFSKNLVAIVNQVRNEGYGYTLSLKQLAIEIPETARNPEGFARVVLLQMLMHEVGEKLLRRHKGALVALIHDRSKYDAVMLDAFNEMLDDPNFEFRNRFTTISSQSWEHCIALQPTDLLAYENYKEAERHMLNLARKRRKSLTAILDEGPALYGGNTGGWTQEVYDSLRRQIDQLDPAIKQKLFRMARTGKGAGRGEIKNG